MSNNSKLLEIASCDNEIIADIAARMERFFEARHTYVLLDSMEYKYLTCIRNVDNLKPVDNSLLPING